MYLVWYILLNIVIFCGFIFPIFYYNYLLNIKKLNFNTYFKLNNFISFKELFYEYNYYLCLYKNFKFNDYLVYNFLNFKLFNVYNPYLNYFTLSNQNSNQNLNFKLNLNYLSNLNIINNFNLKLSKINSINNYKNFFSKIIIRKNLFIQLNKTFMNSINSTWIVKFSPSNFFKYVDGFKLFNYNILFLRKNKVFNKGRYSRNRQYYRTGVYWCLYVNIIAVIGIYFWFYRFTMNFGYLWWLLYLFIMSFILPKTIKFRLYNVNVLFNNYILNFVWLFNILNNFYLLIFSILNVNYKYFNNLSILYFNNFNYIFTNSFLASIVNFFIKFNFFNYKYLNLIEFKLINKII